MAIRKIFVARGIDWVEIPEADLRILCGCPADAVKHLIKRGLIVSQEVKGVTCETGPNAILLSDQPLQNGEFANLAEFPVLQMLYKQGMLLPGHPNNTGQKPLLLGSADQLESQMRYIYRGNYGLISREEMIQAGVSPERADEMMRLKLKFAFGKIAPSSDFLDGRVIGDKPVVVGPDVAVRRIAPNVFEFAHGDQTVSIDLNLGPRETYEAPYPLGFRRFEPEYFGIIHSGEGDGWDVNRPSMSSILTYQGRIYLIDAGPNLGYSLAALGIGVDQIDGLFHTHAHDDHFAGLTTLMRSGRRIRYFATPLVRASVAKKLAALLAMEEERFEDFFDVQDLTFDTWNDVEGLEVKPLLSPHPVETNIFVFRVLWGDGHRSYAHFADIASLDVLKAMITDKADAPGLTAEAFNAVQADYLLPADVKKLDIGGGLIHGAAKDFRSDRTPRILLAHRAAELTAEEKEIGSSAAFGTADVLVPGQSDGLRRQAFAHLEAHLPGAAMHHLRTLLNHPMVEINPGAIIIKEGEIPREIPLLLTGRVEWILARENQYGVLSAGALIGERAGLDQRPSRHTYRAASFVRALRVPSGVLAEILRREGMADRHRHTADLRSFLETTCLFGEGVPVPLLNKIIDGARERRFQVGETASCHDIETLNLIRIGRMERSVSGEPLDLLQAGDFFGEEGAIFRVPCLFHLRAREETTVIQIPGDLLAEVPIVRWKLFEGYRRRVTRIVHGTGESGAFVWRDAFSIRIAEMDTHHKRLVEIANAVMESLRDAADRDALLRAFDALVDYTRYHFQAEEELLARYGYPAGPAHHAHHADLIRQVTDYRADIQRGVVSDAAAFQKFFEGWLVRHILSEDRKYGAFLNSRGVY